MKPNGNFKISYDPSLLISHEDLQRIRHIVDIAPKEAQWFCRMEKIQERSSIYYRIYEMYIPEQYCSTAEVESDPQMMYKFYKELKEEHGVEATNDIMSNLTVWCHSHHNMGVSPSGQDIKQFSENIDNAQKANQTLPQVMLIFNKKDQYHCRIHDFDLGITFQNLPLVIESYDFSNIDDQAKTKFKKKVYPKKDKDKKKSLYSKGSTESWDFLEWGMEEDNNSYSKSLFGQEKIVTEQYIQYGLLDHPSVAFLIKKYEDDKIAFLETLINELTDSQLSIFYKVLDLDLNNLWTLEEGTELKTAVELQQSLEENLDAYDYDIDLITCILIFTLHLDAFPSKAESIIKEFSSVITEWEDLENTYYGEY